MRILNNILLIDEERKQKSLKKYFDSCKKKYMSALSFWFTQYKRIIDEQYYEFLIQKAFKKPTKLEGDIDDKS